MKMKNMNLALLLAAGLATGAISLKAQTTQTETHSHSDGHGNSDSISQTSEITLPPPSGPRVAMNDWAMESSSPYIAVNDPAKFGHSTAKAAFNHDGQAFAEFGVRDHSQTPGEIESGTGRNGEYERNIRSGKWKAFRNGE